MPRQLLLVTLLAACGSSGPQADGGVSFPVDALMSVSARSGALTIAVWTSPQPPTRGVLAVQLAVTNATGPVEGLAIAATPWMADHGHGSSVNPVVSDQGAGVYLLTEVYLAMPGRWDLQLTLDGATNDSATVPLQIP